MSQSQPSVNQQQHTRATEGSGVEQTGAPTAQVGQQYPTRSYLPERVRATSVGLLNQALADLTTVTLQLRHAHWNVKGIEFYQLHELFEDLYESFEPHIDTVAERASALGGRPMGTAPAVAQQSTIPQFAHVAVDGQSLLRELADRLSALDAVLYQQIETASQQGDLDTADLLNEVSRDVTKALWFVESHLQAPRETGTGGYQQQGGVVPQQ